MKPLGFCKQAVGNWKKHTKLVQQLIDHGVMHATLKLLVASQKFSLPEHGYLVENDPQYRALDPTQRLRLPFAATALEYHSGSEYVPTCEYNNQTMRATKEIVLLGEVGDHHIMVLPIEYYPSLGLWVPHMPVNLPATDYLETDANNKVSFVLDRVLDDFEPAAYAKAVFVALGFLNMLACSNVQTQPAKPTGVRKMLAPLAADDYHVVMVGVAATRTGCEEKIGERRSPREHLRRGHIRRLANSNRIWINSMLVAAGRGGGSIVKDYVVPKQ